MKVGVIIGRFQILHPHAGQKTIYKQVRKLNDVVMILLGVSEVPFTNKNPLSLNMRVNQIRIAFNPDHIGSVRDNPDDYKWSNDVDEEILAIFGGVSKISCITLYGSRDSFISHYHGRFNTAYLEEVQGLNSTDHRKLLATEPKVITDDFKHGVIHAVENRFPTAYPTVDIALIKSIERRDQNKSLLFPALYILLGRKQEEELWRFPGGFVDPKDQSLELAASRELNEEVIGIQTHEFKYLCSMKVDDWRYRGTKDGIITSLFLTYIMGGNPIAGDDLKEVKWFPVHLSLRLIIAPFHRVLFDKILKHLNI